MNLKKIVDTLDKSSASADSRALSAIAHAEVLLQQAYEGRYFFELIQNVRDANKEINQNGFVLINLRDNILSISNTGAEFSEKGIEGITTIGKSPKNSQDFIGFKGIGFKSIQEVTEEPKIITKYGTVFFDRVLTLSKYGKGDLDIDSTPLFYFPHYEERILSSDETANGIVTRIELPLKSEINEAKLVEDFSQIQAKQLVLLGNIDNLSFSTETKSINFSIHSYPEKHSIEVIENYDKVSKFKFFSPLSQITIPNSIISSLERKEKEIFSKNSKVDVNIVLELNDNGQFDPINDAQLYLFYPLKITSGFRFLIHSYFIVNPERTALRKSSLNDFLLKSIGEFVGTEMLRHLKENKTNTNKILCFKRIKDSNLSPLYDSLIENLKTQKFVYDNQSKKYFYPNTVVVAEDFNKGLFPDGKFGNKQLIYLDDQVAIDWLKNEFNIPHLSYSDIANEIEKECKRQKRPENLKFFQNLYNYVTRNVGINLIGKKVLLTDEWRLVSSDADVFYGGGRKNTFELPKAIKKEIHFIHREIKISDFREGKSRTGIIEFNTHELVKRLLKLFEKSPTYNNDILNSLFNLELDNKSELEISEKILFPIKGSSKWLSPLVTPIYFETENLIELFPNANFVDETILHANDDTKSSKEKKDFLKKFGVWDIPAVYVVPGRKKLSTSDNREKVIISISGLTSKPYYISNDRILDKPSKYNSWFTSTMINKWHVYDSFIKSSLIPKLQYDSELSTYLRNSPDNSSTFKLSDFAETLTNQKWIVFNGDEYLYSTKDVVGISYLDFIQPHNQVIKRYLKLLSIDYLPKKNFIDTIGLIHLDGNSVENYIKLLRAVQTKFKTIPAEKEFIDFYNRILNKMEDFFYANSHLDSSIPRLTDEYFLAIDEITKQLRWEKARNIFHIDDKSGYDLLPTLIKEKIQPHFTKRDKHTFGKIAAKIGKRFSNAVSKRLIESESSNAALLIRYFNYLPESIALLESILDVSVSNYIESIKAIKVFESNKLEIAISVSKSQETIISVNCM